MAKTINMGNFLFKYVKVYLLRTRTLLGTDSLTPIPYLSGLWCYWYSGLQPQYSEDELNTTYFCVRIQYTLSLEVVRLGTLWDSVDRLLTTLPSLPPFIILLVEKSLYRDLLSLFFFQENYSKVRYIHQRNINKWSS